MSKRIVKIELGDEESNLNFEGDITTLDIFFSISMLFDILEPKERKLLLDKLGPTIFRDFKSGK
ncbi:hypothetical protein CLOHAE12215_00090 [Clostridium haemolyticum]|uniref:hypothetical protein n=1 Tax=Clostridium TaxID=1485 RepID=UPI001C3995F2|nr:MULTISPECIES: hypothetical protein [Clostridium]MCD3218144.1 hypothetical protein [Clostridium botulinum C]CAG7838743.1 hypothetical protein CLOHAE12215_00090 [Clostridium haemolyticum]